MKKRGRPKKQKTTMADKMYNSLLENEKMMAEILELTKIQTQCMVFLVQNDKKTSIACPQFSKYLEDKVKLWVPSQWVYGSGKKW